jgi:hypothetical protein
MKLVCLTVSILNGQKEGRCLQDPTLRQTVIRSWSSLARGDQCERAANLICLAGVPCRGSTLVLFPASR